MLGNLLRIAQDDTSYWVIMDVLTSFVRANYPRQDTANREGRAPEDLQAVCDVLARRGPVHERQRIDGNSPVDLSYTDLSGAWLAHCHFEGAYMQGSKLCRVDFRDAHLKDANLCDTCLKEAIFTQACVSGANLWGADLTDAEFGGVDLRKVEGLKSEQLALAKGDADTQIRDYLQRPESWDKTNRPI